MLPEIIISITIFVAVCFRNSEGLAPNHVAIVRCDSDKLFYDNAVKYRNINVPVLLTYGSEYDDSLVSTLVNNNFKAVFIVDIQNPNTKITRYYFSFEGNYPHIVIMAKNQLYRRVWSIDHKNLNKFFKKFNKDPIVLTTKENTTITQDIKKLMDEGENLDFGTSRNVVRLVVDAATGTVKATVGLIAKTVAAGATLTAGVAGLMSSTLFGGAKAAVGLLDPFWSQKPVYEKKPRLKTFNEPNDSESSEDEYDGKSQRDGKNGMSRKQTFDGKRKSQTESSEDEYNNNKSQRDGKNRMSRKQTFDGKRKSQSEGSEGEYNNNKSQRDGKNGMSRQQTLDAKRKSQTASPVDVDGTSQGDATNPSRQRSLDGQRAESDDSDERRDQYEKKPVAVSQRKRVRKRITGGR